MEKYFAAYILASQRNGTLYTADQGVETRVEAEAHRGKNPEWRDLFSEICQ